MGLKRLLRKALGIRQPPDIHEIGRYAAVTARQAQWAADVAEGPRMATTVIPVGPEACANGTCACGPVYPVVEPAQECPDDCKAACCAPPVVTDLPPGWMDTSHEPPQFGIEFWKLCTPACRTCATEPHLGPVYPLRAPQTGGDGSC